MALTDSSSPACELSSIGDPRMTVLTTPEGEMTKDFLALSMIMPLDLTPLMTRGLRLDPEPLNGGPIRMGMDLRVFCGRLSKILTSIWRSGTLRLMIMLRLAASASRMGKSTCSCNEAKAAAVSASRPVYLEFLQFNSNIISDIKISSEKGNLPEKVFCDREAGDSGDNVLV